MHQPASAPRRSIYYDYTVHQPWLPSQHPAQPLHPVVIAGGGPVGLTAALELARFGVPCVLLESEQQVCEGSRAIVFTRRSMEILQQVGVAERVTQNGLPWRFGNSFYRGQRVFRMEAPHDDNDRFGPMINLQQQFLEQYLVEACQANPLIDLRWGNRVMALEQHADHAQLQVDTPKGPYTLQAEWLVASDGARSAIRSLLDLKLEGASYEGRFVIADIRIDLPLPTERLAFFDPDGTPATPCCCTASPWASGALTTNCPRAKRPSRPCRPNRSKPASTPNWP
jgi:3-(3-hydroxy-phenyl)propionate hydroxylase